MASLIRRWPSSSDRSFFVCPGCTLQGHVLDAVIGTGWGHTGETATICGRVRFTDDQWRRQATTRARLNPRPVRVQPGKAVDLGSFWLFLLDYAAAFSCSRQSKVAPSSHIRCMITAIDAWAPQKPRPDETFIRVLTRAHRWERLIEDGTCRSAAEIAEAEGVTRSFINCILRLTLLAPHIQEAVLDGRQPKGLQLVELTRARRAAGKEKLAHVG